MKPAQYAEASQVYSHRDTEGVWRHFHIGALEKDIQAGYIKPSVINAELEPHVVEAIREHSGLERRGFEFALQRLDEPIMIAMFEDESVIVIDGNHRMVARYDLGFTHVKAYILLRHVWEQYLIEGIPDELAQKAIGL